ncbi:MAG: flagellar biosynthetic protein FliR [Acidobacteriota bacterium]
MNDVLPLSAFGLLLVRPGMLVVASPVFGGSFVPPPVRIGLTVAVAALLLPAVEVPAALSSLGLVVVTAGEVVIGLALALAVRALQAGAELAGHLAGFQAGMSYAALVDPQSGARNSVVAALYSSLALLAFFGINGHHALLRALAQSYRVLPPGTWGLARGDAGDVAAMLGLVFLLGAQLAMPVVIVLLVLEIVLGLLSRAAPALNFMILGFPVRVAVGLLTLAVGITMVPDIVARFAPAAVDGAMRLIGTAR